MTDASTTNSDIASLQNDIAALTRDVGNLVQHLTAKAGSSAEAMASQIDDSTRKLYRNIATEGERSLKGIGAKVEEQPLIALLVALGVGYFGGRLLSR